MSNEKALELLQEMQEKIEDVENQLSEAKDYAQSAMNEASRAEDEACEAQRSASEAENYCDYAAESLEELSSLHQELRDQLEARSGVDADVAKHKARVLQLTKQGLAVNLVAKKMDISEVLVNIILGHSRPQAA